MTFYKIAFDFLTRYYALKQEARIEHLQLQVVDAIAEKMKREINEILFRFLIGVICAAVFIFAFIKFGNQMEGLLTLYQSGEVINLTVFGLLALASAVGIASVFKDKKQDANPAPQSTHQSTHENTQDDRPKLQFSKLSDSLSRN